MSVLEKYETQYADETGKVEPKHIIPMGKYIGRFDFFSAEEDPQDTEYGVPGRLVTTWNANLSSEEGKTEVLKFIKATPQDYRKNWETGEWFAPGHAEHKSYRQVASTKNWRMMTKFDKKNDMPIAQSVKAIQEHIYDVTIGAVYEKVGEKDQYVRGVDDTHALVQQGYTPKSHWLIGAYPRKDNAV